MLSLLLDFVSSLRFLFFILFFAFFESPHCSAQNVGSFLLCGRLVSPRVVAYFTLRASGWSLSLSRSLLRFFPASLGSFALARKHVKRGMQCLWLVVNPLRSFVYIVENLSRLCRSPSAAMSRHPSRHFPVVFVREQRKKGEEWCRRVEYHGHEPVMCARACWCTLALSLDRGSSICVLSLPLCYFLP